MPSKAEPLVGLVWVADFDPTTGGGVAAPLWQFLIRTDTEQLYFKSGTANTAWTSLGGGGGGSLTVDQDGTPIVDPATTLNFTGAAVNVTDAGGGQADVDIGVNVYQDETPKVTRAKQINFAGDEPVTVTVTDLGSGIANVVIGGSKSAAQNGILAFAGTEDPNNIPIALAVPMSGDYIVQLTYWPGDPGVSGTNLPYLISQTDAQNFVIGLTAAPIAGDQVMYSALLRT